MLAGNTYSLHYILIYSTNLDSTVVNILPEKAMATHSSVLAWRIPGRGSLVGCRLWGHTELDTTEVT